MTSTLPTLRLRAVENVLSQLADDMRTVAEARCALHGTDGPTPNPTAGLLPFIGVEIIAERSTRSGSRDDNLRRVFAEVAAVTGYKRYDKLGFPLFKLVRHGLAHGFWPNEAPVKGSRNATFMMMFQAQPGGRTKCLDDLPSRSQTGHLKLLSNGQDRILRVIVQHLILDVTAYITHFRQRLQNDQALQVLVEANDKRLATTTSGRLKKQLSAADLKALMR